MSSPEQKQPDQEKPKLDIEELQRQMAELQAKVEQAKQEEEKKRAEQKEATIAEKVGEMESTYTEGKNTEAELENVNSKITTAESALQKFEEVAQQAKEMGMDVSSQLESFTQAMQEEKDRLVQLQTKQAELQAKVEKLAGDSEVMDKIEESARQEGLERDHASVSQSESNEDTKESLEAENERISKLVKNLQDKQGELNEQRIKLRKIMSESEASEEMRRKLDEISHESNKIEGGRLYELRKEFEDQDTAIYDELMELDKELKRLWVIENDENLRKDGGLKLGVEFPSKGYYESLGPINKKQRELSEQRRELNLKYQKLIEDQAGKWEENGIRGLQEKQERIQSRYKELSNV